MKNVQEERQKKKSMWGLYVGIVAGVIVLYFVQEHSRQAELNAARAKDTTAQAAPVKK